MLRPLTFESVSRHTPESLVEQLTGEPGLVLLRSALFGSPQARYSFVAARPFLTFRSFGARCELRPLQPAAASQAQFGNPWRLLDSLLARFELLDELDLPFPLGGCFGYWGYDLKNFIEPKLRRRALDDLELPDCHLGFYDSLVVFDHLLGKTWIVSTGLQADGSRNPRQAASRLAFWQSRLESELPPARPGGLPRQADPKGPGASPVSNATPIGGNVFSNVTGESFIKAVEQAQSYIRAGDIYQVNLSQRLQAAFPGSGWQLYQQLSAVSPAPFAAFYDAGAFQLVSSSPELFLRLSGAHAQTRPIKGTRPRAVDPTRDAQLAYDLRTSPKEMAELVMITDLLRNDLGRVCEFGSVQAPELAKLERYPQVQHLVSAVEGRLRPGVTHLGALAACFPGGSITGAPKFRAMEIIDELEPVVRGPYTGALGYLGFNRESQLSILIRTAVLKEATAYFQVGAGIVADSNPADEYQETLAKAAGFLAALRCQTLLSPCSSV